MSERAELIIEAAEENLSAVQEFIAQRLETAGCSSKTLFQINIAVEEVFINIACYAYVGGKGKATVCVELSETPASVAITFMDGGIPYNPLAREDPDITLAAEDRQVGGLGILMIKRLMDDVRYEYKDGRNILRLIKNL